MKYNAKKVTIDGICFDSKKEGERYLHLKLLERAGEILGLKIKPEFPIILNGVKVCKYVGDYEYSTKEGSSVVEDVKGFKTPVYRLKKKLVKAVYGIDIFEI